MKLFTNENNTATLKLLIAAKFVGKHLEIINSNLEAVTLPGKLPVLEVDDNVSFFSSNAALQYLLPTVDLSVDGQCVQMLEWEATRLSPAVAAVLTSKTVASDLKQVLQSCMENLNGLLEKSFFLIGEKMSAADISIWCSLYPIYYTEDLKNQYIDEYKYITKWFEAIAAEDSVKNALKEWGGSPKGPFAAQSILGTPQIPSLVSPAGSPDEIEEGPNAEEIEAAKDNWKHGVERLQPVLKQEKVVLPVKGRKNVLITSALPYVNNVPHLGNIIGCVLSADIFARYCRMCDYNTLFICGTDEYGTATETKALEEGCTPRQICDKYFDIHNSVYRWFNIGFDYFGRTSTEEQTKIAQKMFLKLNENGFVSTQSVDQLHCENCDRFLADRFVEGICPHPTCGYESARGDQCDRCGRLVTATELKSPKCKVCSHSPVVKPSTQMFIELPQLEPSLRSWISKTEQHWSPAARAVTRAWLREPLRCRAVTRDLKWGVQVPIKGFENKVFYVWFDAPIGYLSITQNATKNFESWWKPDKEYDVQLYQFMAKDNVPFHVIMFPATIIGVNEGHVLVKHIFATEYLNYEEGKFSKSRGVGVFGTDAQDTGIPSDVWRFYLASIRPETSDSSFSWVELGTRNNSELLNNLGNFCHRSLSFCANSFKGVVPDTVLEEADYNLIALVNREVIAYVQNMEKGRLRDSLRHVLLISKLGNQHMQAQQPWVLLKGTDEDKIRGATAIGFCCQLVALICALLTPYMPETSRKLREQLNVGPQLLRINPKNPSMIQYLPRGHKIGKPEPLFAKLDPEKLEELKKKYAGTQSDRENKQNLPASIKELEAAIAAQGDLVRKLKASSDKATWQPEVEKLLALKKQLAEAQTRGESNSIDDLGELEKKIAEQGEKVRKLKASTKDKAVWRPEVNILLDLKKNLAVIQADTATKQPSQNGVADLEKAIAEQGDKVRKLKASTKDKTVWQPEVNVLLDLKKQLAALQTQ